MTWFECDTLEWYFFTVDHTPHEELRKKRHCRKARKIYDNAVYNTGTRFIHYAPISFTVGMVFETNFRDADCTTVRQGAQPLVQSTLNYLTYSWFLTLSFVTSLLIALTGPYLTDLKHHFTLNFA